MTVFFGAYQAPPQSGKQERSMYPDVPPSQVSFLSYLGNTAYSVTRTLRLSIDHAHMDSTLWSIN